MQKKVKKYLKFQDFRVTKLSLCRGFLTLWCKLCRILQLLPIQAIPPYSTSCIHPVFCLKTGPKPPPKRCLHMVRSRVSSFKWEYPLLSLGHPVASYVFFLIFIPLPSPPLFFLRQLLRKMWPIQLAFCFLISCRIFLCSLTVSNTSSFLTWSVQLIFSFLLQHHISKLSRYFWSAAQSVQVSAPYKAMLQM